MTVDKKEDEKQQTNFSIFSPLITNALTAENCSMGITLGVLVAMMAASHNWFGSTISREKSLIWIPLAVPIVAQCSSGFFSRLRENRATIRSDLKQLNTDTKEVFNMADSALKEKHYFQAVKLFEQAKKGFLQLHGDSKNLCAKEQYYTVCYKQALAYFYMGHLVSSKKILEESLSTPADLELNKDAFNLRGLIQFKLGKFNLAKNDFEQSLKLYKAQNVIYLFKLFLTGDYRTLIKHLGYTRALGTEPFSSDEPWLTSELLQIYGEAFLKLDKYFEAIKMIDAAIKSLPNSAIYMIEKAKLTALLAFAYYKLSHEEYKEEEINISMLDGATRTISVKYFEESINQYIEQADSLLAEAKNLDSEDPRNKYVEDLIIEIKSNMEDFKPSVSLKT